MAVVVWVFAGGGESEVRGLIPFLEKNYTQHQFERKSPVRLKPGPKPTVQPGYGLTGKSLVDQLGKILHIALATNEICDSILVIDDLDCHDPLERKGKLNKTIDEVIGARKIEAIIGFAAPEIEAWIIADWDQTIAQDIDFRGCYQAMRQWMSATKHVSFSTPEAFSKYDPNKNACVKKLSDVLIEAAERSCVRNAYSKAIHTPRFIEKLSPQVVGRKCPLFRDLHNQLSKEIE
jgi:Domain of unknown function (DUF4276)